jgi:hypothetical protein
MLGLFMVLLSIRNHNEPDSDKLMSHPIFSSFLCPEKGISIEKYMCTKFNVHGTFQEEIDALISIIDSYFDRVIALL